MYKYLIMPFGLNNTFNSFIRLINHVLYEILKRFVVVCFDDKLMYSCSLEKHIEHM